MCLNEMVKAEASVPSGMFENVSKLQFMNALIQISITLSYFCKDKFPPKEKKKSVSG